MSLLEQGCIDVFVDKIVPCLLENETGEVKETVVFKIESRAYLKKFQDFINEEQAKKLLEVYHYEWNET